MHVLDAPVNRWCSENTLLVGLIITACSSEQRLNQQGPHADNLTPGARPM